MIKLSNKDYYTTQEAANILQVRPKTIQFYLKKGYLKGYKPSRNKTFFTLEQIENFLEGKNKTE